MKRVIITDPNTIPATWAFEEDCWFLEVPDDDTTANIEEKIRKMAESPDWSEIR